MQRTRLNQLIDVLLFRLTEWLRNPWRKTSLLLISLLFGIFLSNIISTVSGQIAALDVLIAAYLLLFTELVNFWVYGRSNRRNLIDFWLGVLNAFKLGLVYNFFVEAFKLGS